MTASVQQERELAALLTARWEQASRKIAELAEAIPAKEFDSRRLTSIRSTAEILRHVAFWNQYVVDTLNGKQADDAGNELPAADYATKTRIMEALRRTSADVAVALRKQGSEIDLKAAELILTFVEHTSEHYGQLVVYARLMGIVPPASQS